MPLAVAAFELISPARMAVFELVIALLFGGALLSAGARRVKVTSPALLALAGVALALVPNAPRLAPDLRKRGVIGDDAYHRVEEELDWEELNAQTLVR
jgi:hypothetical protein